MKGGAGNDGLDGGVSFDTADYSDKTGSVVVTLNGNQPPGDGRRGGRGYHSARSRDYGGPAGDTLTGDGLANVVPRRRLALTFWTALVGVDTADYSDKDGISRGRR